jgi:hypothetical protein
MSEMVTQATLHHDLDSTSPTARAVRQLWAEIERACARRDDADALVKRLASTLELLLDELPAAERDDYRRRLAKIRGGDWSLSEGRGTEVHQNVIDLFKRGGRRDWTVPDIQAALSKAGEETDPRFAKAIYNTLNYLAKKGTIKRVSWGQYIFCDIGAGIADHDLDGIIPDDGTIRRSENDD